MCEFLITQSTTEMVLRLLANLVGFRREGLWPAGNSCLQRWSLGAQLMNSSKMSTEAGKLDCVLEYHVTKSVTCFSFFSFLSNSHKYICM